MALLIQLDFPWLESTMNCIEGVTLSLSRLLQVSDLELGVCK